MTTPTTDPGELRRLLGDMDIYLVDQLMRGRLTPDMTVLDAGCGKGRNSHYLLKAGFQVHAVDLKPENVLDFREAAWRVVPDWPIDNAAVAPLDDLPFPDERFDAVLANAVLHFSESPSAFAASVDELWRVVKPGGFLWARLTSSIGLEDRVEALGDQRFKLPDGSERFLVSEQDLLDTVARLGGSLLDPIKTTNVQGLRCMTTWVVGKA
jgi:SAM-dependent methyltransferase